MKRTLSKRLSNLKNEEDDAYINQMIELNNGNEAFISF